MASYTTTANVSGDVYYYWVNADTGTSTTCTDNTIWRTWTSDSTGDYTGSTYDYTWSNWINPTIIHKVNPIIEKAPLVITPKRTSEQERARSAQAEINRIRIEELKEQKRQAELTAQELLEDLIGEEELARYKETNRLVVRGRKSDYVIDKTRGVWKVDKDKVVDLCIHLKRRYKYPETDNVISLKLLIEANESEFLRTANIHGEIGNMVTKERILELVKRAA